MCSLEALVGMTQPMLGCREGFDAAVAIMCLESAALEPKTLLTPLLAVWLWTSCPPCAPQFLLFPSLQTASSKCLSSNASRPFYSVEKSAQPMMSRRCGDEGGRLGGIGRHSEYGASCCRAVPVCSQLFAA